MVKQSAEKLNEVDIGGIPPLRIEEGLEGDNPACEVLLMMDEGELRGEEVAAGVQKIMAQYGESVELIIIEKSSSEFINHISESFYSGKDRRKVIFSGFILSSEERAKEWFRSVVEFASIVQEKEGVDWEERKNFWFYYFWDSIDTITSVNYPFKLMLTPEDRNILKQITSGTADKLRADFSCSKKRLELVIESDQLFYEKLSLALGERL